MKTEVYSWRVSADLKIGLEREAQRRKMSLSAVLDLAARDWLKKGEAEVGDDEAQLRLHKDALKCLGAFASGDEHRSEKARQTLRNRLRKNYDR